MLINDINLVDLKKFSVYNNYMVLEYIVKNDKYSVLRQVLKNEFNISNRLLVKLKKNNCIKVNNEHCYIDFLIKNGDLITVDINFNEESKNIVPTNIPLDIIYEDDALLIINKPPFLPIHPSHLHFEDTISNGVQYHFNKIGLKRKIRPVNRLDKDTSGLVVFAKNEYIQECLVKQMKSGDFEKEYIAVLEGNIHELTGIINAPIARKENSIIERCVDNSGDVAVTHYTVLENSNNYCFVKFKLETGRTHQIRVHSRYIGHPILGDTLYGTASSLINRQALHAYRIKFIHPITKERLEFIAELPEDIKKLKSK
ncbi:MAG: RluA family pseudouridine synthase [Clostridia bacterium]|nr:RluA family pseudouridine synthase [Clostridia bacterium]